MKTLLNTIAITALVATFSTPAFASISQDIRSAAGTNGNIRVRINGDTITLSGFVEDSFARSKAERIAKNAGFKVQNCLLLSN